MASPAAARVGDPITHTSAMTGLLVGAAVGLVLGAAVVATGGAAALAIAGAAATGASLGGMAGQFLGGLATSTTGALLTGSPNVRINGRPATFCSSTAACSKHPGPTLVMQGSSTVGINGRPAARTGDKGACGFAIGPGSPNVSIGGAPGACGPVGSEVPAWADGALMVLGLAGGAGLLRAAGHGAAAIAARLGGSVVGGAAGSAGGGYVGGRVFGEGSTGQSVLAFGGAFVGGGLGYRGGARLDAYPRANPFNYRPYADPGTLGSNFGNVRGRYVGPATQGSALTSRPIVGRPATFGTSASPDYKRTFFDAHPQLEGKVVVHHAVEQQVLRRYPGVVSESQMHSLQNLRGIPKAVNSDVHLSQIRRAWNQFYRETPNPTQEQLLRKATEIDDLFGSQFNPPVR